MPHLRVRHRSQVSMYVVSQGHEGNPMSPEQTARRIGHIRTTFTFATNGALGITGKMAKTRILSLLMSLYLITAVMAYDPKDEMLKDILLPDGQFEAFYLKGAQSEEENAARPPHLHGSFNKYRNPALVGAPNSAAYGFRFDGKRRFNYD